VNILFKKETFWGGIAEDCFWGRKITPFVERRAGKKKGRFSNQKERSSKKKPVKKGSRDRVRTAGGGGKSSIEKGESIRA